MDRLLSSLLVSMKVESVISANRLINFLKHIPLIKKAIPPGIYANYSLKTVFTVLGLLITAVRKIVFRLIYVVFVAITGVFLSQAAAAGGLTAFFAAGASFGSLNYADIVCYSLSFWLALSLSGALTGSVTAGVHSHEHDFVMLSHFYVNPAVYAKTRIVFRIFLDSILYLPYMTAFAVSGTPLLCIFAVLLIYAGFRLCGEAVNLLMFRYSGRHFGKFPFNLAGILFFCASFCIPLFAGTPDWMLVLSNPLTLFAAAAAGVLAALYIKNYPCYSQMLRERITMTEELIIKNTKTIGDKNTLSNSSAGLKLGDAKNWNRGLKKEKINSGRFDGKTGFAYLNAVFFDRHRKFFRTKILQRCIIILIPLAALISFSVYCLISEGVRPSEIFMDADGAVMYGVPIKSVFNISPMFFYIIYFASMGKAVTAAVFSNCDIEMLHYPYYRTRETIFASFRSRFAAAVKFNLIIITTIAFTAAVSLRILYGYTDLLYTAVFCVLIIFMGVFFAFNDLLLYYVIQPFDSRGQSKSIMYSVINIIIYAAAYSSVQLKFDFMIFTAGFIIFTVLYLGIGTGLLLLLAPSRFKLR